MGNQVGRGNGSRPQEGTFDSPERLKRGGGNRPREGLRSQSGAGEHQLQQNGPHAVEDEGRGRHASKPSDIPARGWKDILWRVYENISEHRIMAVAAGVAF
jgi:membrane protein